MHIFYRLSFLLYFGLFSNFCAASDPQAEITQMLNYFADVWTEGDLESIRSYYHPDFVFVSSIGTSTKQQRLEELGVIMAPGKDHGDLTFSDIQVQAIGTDHALAYGRNRLKFKDGTEMGSMFSSVYVNTPFGWKAILTHQ